MKFTISKHYFNESIQQVSKAVTGRSAIPILSGLKIEANEHGIVITGSDADISIQSFIPSEKNDQQIIQLERKGSVVLPAKFLGEITRKLPANDIEVDVNINHLSTIRSGTSEIQLVGFDPEEYPLLPSIEEHQSFSIPSDLLKTMIKQTSFAVATNESTPILTGIRWSVAEQKLKFVACDRLRMATREAAIQTEDDIDFNNVVISGKSLNELSKLLPDQNMLVDIVIAENQILIKIDHILFYSRLLDGTYPDTTKLIPVQFNTELKIQTKLLTNAIDRANLLSREEKTNIVKMILKENNQVEIFSSSNELGRVTETIDAAKLNGELIQLSFNAKYMLDALKVFDSDYIKIGIKGSMQPIIIVPEDHTNVLQLIMPIRS